MMPYVDAALFVGMMGYWGYHTQRHVVSIHNKLKRVSKHGCMTFPMIYDANSMGELLTCAAGKSTTSRTCFC